MVALLVSFILLYVLETEAFQNLTGCSVGKKHGICMTQSDCFGAAFAKNECHDGVCCLDTRISYRKCLEYGKKLPNMKRTEVKFRILGGTDTKTNEFPFMVAIGKEPESADKEKWFCGGSIISESFVLTAAHCIQTENTTSYMVLAGTSRLNGSEGQLRVAAEATLHPKFAPWKLGYDLALLRVAPPFRLSRRVFPLCLIGPSALPAVSRALATGFGVEEAGKTKGSGSLKKVRLKIFSPHECDDFYPAIVQYGGYKPSLLCAGVLGGGKDSCQGDSGGPLSVPLVKPAGQYGLVGVTSAGLSCGLSNSPGLYIKVPYFLSWIEKHVWGEELEKHKL